MGCDVHSMVEVRRDGVWKYYELELRPDPYLPDQRQFNTREPWVCQDYLAFGVMAGVRQDPVDGQGPIAEARGIPTDASQEARWAAEEEPHPDDWDVWLGDHSHSWVSLAELLASAERLQDTELVDTTIPLLQAIPDTEPEDIRMVFGFDN